MPDTNYYLKPGEATDAYNQRISAYNASKTPTASAQPSISSLYGSVSENDKYIDTSTSYYKGIAETPIDEDAIRSNTMRALQAEIDATNRLYADKLREAQQQGIGRIGSGNAIQARRGLIGSDFGASQGQQIVNQNNEIEGGIRNENAAAISSITGRGNAMAQEEIAAKNAARQQGAEAYLKYLSESDSRRTNRSNEAAQRALAAGFDLTSADDASIKAIAESYNISPDALRLTYKQLSDAKAVADAEAQAAEQKAALDADLTRSNIAKNGRIEIGEGTAVYDAQGNRIAYNPKTYKPDAGTAPAPGSIVDANGKSIKLTATQVDTVSGFDNTVRSANDALTILAKGVKTGPIAGAGLQANKFRDAADPDQLKLEQTLAQIKASYMKALSGAAVSEQEVKRLAKFLPDIYDQEGVLKSKLETLMNDSSQKKTGFLSTLGAAGPSSQTVIAPDGTEVQIID